MTQTTPLSKKTSSTSGLLNSAYSLLDEISIHNSKEKASFHVPGHKGRWWKEGFEQCDLTEVGNLDDLSNPAGVLADLEQRISRVWGARYSFISTNGASAALTAALLAAGKSGAPLLLPRHSHRSAIHALVLGDLQPVWYENAWEDDWGVWGGLEFERLEAALQSGVGAMLVVSPRYEGGLEPIARISELCRRHNVLLIVDEAHGAHQVDRWSRRGALAQGADLVIHSLHKTLGALTQIGLLHIGESCRLDADRLRGCLSLLSSSSPSYLFLSSVAQMVSELEAGSQRLAWLESAAAEFRFWAVSNNYSICNYDDGDRLHCLIRRPGTSSQALHDHLAGRGIYAEGVFGSAVLLVLGIGNTCEDFALLKSALEQFACPVSTERDSLAKPNPIVQALSPRLAFFAASEAVEPEKASGRVAAECLAKCPPGTAVMVPGQLITDVVAGGLPPERKVRVSVEVQGDA